MKLVGKTSHGMALIGKLSASRTDTHEIVSLGSDRLQVEIRSPFIDDDLSSITDLNGKTVRIIIEILDSDKVVLLAEIDLQRGRVERIAELLEDPDFQSHRALWNRKYIEAVSKLDDLNRRLEEIE